MKLHELSTLRKNAKNRVGRGIAAGQGKTAGRGTKGQKSRTGYKAPKRIPGMMSASDYRMPKRKGFKSHRPAVTTVTLDQLEAFFNSGDKVTPDTLVEKKVITSYSKAGVKVLATGTLTKKLTFDNINFTQQAAATVEKLNKKSEKAETEKKTE